MSLSHWSVALPKSACSEAVEWATTQPDYETAWAKCERADWMLWLIGHYDDSARMSYERRAIVRCTLDIVETVRHLMPPVAVECIDLVARWCDGVDVTLDEMRAAGDAARDAAQADAGAAWAAAAWDAARDAAQAASLRSSAEIVRHHYPTGPVLR